MGYYPNRGGCMARATRQLKILEIIAKYDIDTQEDLVAKLRQEGFNVTQATVSRDVKDMNIIKVLSPDGRHYKYVAQQETASGRPVCGCWNNRSGPGHDAENPCLQER